MKLDPERLAVALVASFRELAKEHWPYLRGDGWPAYNEHDSSGLTVHVFLVSEIAARLAAEYEATPDAEELHPAAEWNLAGMDR